MTALKILFAKGGLAMRRTGFKNRKGFTLSELCIVLALVAMVSTIVISFCPIMNKRSAISRARLDIVNEVNAVETLIEKWVDKMSEQGAVFGKAEDGSLVATVNNADYGATFVNGEFKASVPDGDNEMTFATTRIESMAFDLVSEDGDTIFFCTATALLTQVNSDAKEEKYTFCVNSRIGESFEEVTQ
jgi:prepilin-type N-terminal cleavage/methylation domain-containing protein